MTADLPPEMRFEELLGEFSDIDGVTLPHGGGGFGRSALRYRGKIFAMYVRGALVVKLPGQRVDELVGAGHGARFDANKGTPMREWFTVAPDCPLPWSALAAEALDFARQAASKPLQHPRRPGRQDAHDGQVGRTLTSATASGSRRIAVMRRSASLAGCPVRSRSTQIERKPIRAAGRMSCTQLFAM